MWGGNQLSSVLTHHNCKSKLQRLMDRDWNILHICRSCQVWKNFVAISVNRHNNLGIKVDLFTYIEGLVNCGIFLNTIIVIPCSWCMCMYYISITMRKTSIHYQTYIKSFDILSYHRFMYFFGHYLVCCLGLINTMNFSFWEKQIRYSIQVSCVYHKISRSIGD